MLEKYCVYGRERFKATYINIQKQSLDEITSAETAEQLAQNFFDYLMRGELPRKAVFIDEAGVLGSYFSISGGGPTEYRLFFDVPTNFQGEKQPGEVLNPEQRDAFVNALTGYLEGYLTSPVTIGEYVKSLFTS